MWAARCWATDGPGLFEDKADGRGAIADARAMQLSAEDIAELSAALDDAEDSAGQDGVWEEHVPAVSLFLAAHSQWRTVALSLDAGIVVRRTGLDYPALESIARIQGIAIDGALFHQVQLLEVAALNAFNGRRS